LQDALIAIRDNAFYASQFPVMVTLENHCGMERQVEMAKHLSAILGSLIAKPADYDFTKASPQVLLFCIHQSSRRGIYPH
jgi:hypothetical protein